jgi:hypothetical protein
VHAQADNHQPVDRAARDAHPERHGEADGKGLRAIHRSERAQDERRGDARQRVDRTNREVDPARDDDDGGADRHDRKEAGVGGRLNERVGIEEVVDLGACHPVNMRSGERGQQQAERRDDQDEPGLFGGEDFTQAPALSVRSAAHRL